MATPQEKLAESLDALRKLQDRGVVAIRAADLSRAHRERLLKNGFLQEVMKGWYIPARPDDAARESTAWYASFWAFCAAYLRERFGSEWCLSPEQSLSLHAGNHAVPPQLVVRTPRGGNKATALPHGTSLFDVRAAVPEEKDIEVKDGLRLVLIARSADCQLARDSSSTIPLTRARRLRRSAMLRKCWTAFWRAGTARSPGGLQELSATSGATVLPMTS